MGQYVDKIFQFIVSYIFICASALLLTSQALAATDMFVNTESDSLALRAGAGNAPPKCWVHKGTPVTATGDISSEWVRVSVPSLPECGSGWMWGSFLKELENVGGSRRMNNKTNPQSNSPSTPSTSITTNTTGSNSSGQNFASTDPPDICYQSEKRNRRNRAKSAQKAEDMESPKTCTAIKNNDSFKTYIYNQMQSYENTGGVFTKNDSLSAFCPAFNSMNDQQKLKAWVWFWTVLAYIESSCSSTVVHGILDANGNTLNPNVGFGLWAMEMDESIREWRGPKCEGDGDAITDVKRQADCAIHTMSKELKREGSVMSCGSYWGPIRRRTIVDSMNLHAPCGNQTNIESATQTTPQSERRTVN